MPPDVELTRRQMEVLIYWGASVREASDGLETVYETLLALETAIKDAVTLTRAQAARSQGNYLKARFVETLTDEDRLPLYKLFASPFTVEG